MIKIKAVEQKLMVGPKAGQYVYMLGAETYSSLVESKVIEEASLRSGIQKGALQAAFSAIGETIKAWATEGHSVPVPGLGTMRFSVNAKSVSDVNLVASSLITTRKIVFTPSTDVKKALHDASISITCYDRNGNVVKRVSSSDSGTMDDPEGSGTDNTETGGSGSGVEDGGEMGEREREYYYVPFRSRADNRLYGWFHPDRTDIDVTLRTTPDYLYTRGFTIEDWQLRQFESESGHLTR